MSSQAQPLKFSPFISTHGTPLQRTEDQQENYECLLDSYSQMWRNVQDYLIMTNGPTVYIELVQTMLLRWLTSPGLEKHLQASTEEIEQVHILIGFLSRLAQDYHNVDYFRNLVNEVEPIEY